MMLISRGPPPSGQGQGAETSGGDVGEEALEVGGAVRRLAKPRVVVVKINKRISRPIHRFPLEVKYETSPWP